jgi:hypothetical protein
MFSWLQPILAIVLFVFFLFASHSIWDAVVRWLTVPTRVDSVQSLAKQYQRIYQQLGVGTGTSRVDTITAPKTDAIPELPMNPHDIDVMKDELQDFLQTSLMH